MASTNPHHTLPPRPPTLSLTNLASTDPHHAHFMALTNIHSTLSDLDRFQLVNNICFLINNKHLAHYPARDFNIITIKSTPGIWSGLPNAYRIDVTYLDKSIIFGNEVASRIDALDGLRRNVEKRAGQVTLSRSGAPNGRIAAGDQQTEWPKRPERSGAKGDVRGSDPVDWRAVSMKKHGFTERAREEVLSPEKPSTSGEKREEGARGDDVGTGVSEPCRNHENITEVADTQRVVTGVSGRKRKANTEDEGARKRAKIEVTELAEANTKGKT